MSNPFVPFKSKSKSNDDDAITKFLNNGGKVIKLSEDFKPEKNPDLVIMLDDEHLSIREITDRKKNNG